MYDTITALSNCPRCKTTYLRKHMTLVLGGMQLDYELGSPIPANAIMNGDIEPGPQWSFWGTTTCEECQRQKPTTCPTCGNGYTTSWEQKYRVRFYVLNNTITGITETTAEQEIEHITTRNIP